MSCAATWPAQAGRTTSEPGRRPATCCRRGCASRINSPSRSSRRRRKLETGHDENISRDQAADLVGDDLLRDVERVAVALYSHGAEHARERGIILADTKFEFGEDADGQLVLADEALTPDSSRFWPADAYEPGRSQPSFDKQYVRDYAETLGWDKTDPGPELPDDVVAGTRARYVEAFERVTGIAFEAYVEDPSVVLR